MLGGDGRRHELSQVLAEEFAAIVENPKAVDAYGIDAPLDDALKTAADEARMLERWPKRQAAAVERSRRRLLYNAAHGFDLSALCLSGGGIRSASFALGVIQCLADKKLLAEFNYLSTVSGGGYIGSWLSAWLKWEQNADEVIGQLRQQRKDPDAEPQPIQHLRQYSAYLTPKSGLFSGDLWAPIAIIIRNLLLNWLILLPVIAAPVIAIKLTAALIHTAPLSCNAIVILIGLACFFLGGLSFRYKLKRLYLVRRKNLPAHEDSRFIWRCLFPAVVAGLCFTWLAELVPPPTGPIARVASSVTVPGWPSIVVIALLVYALVWVSLCKIIRRRRAVDQIAWLVSAIAWGSLIWLGIYLYGKLATGGSDDIVALGSLCIKVTKDCAASTIAQPIGIDRQLLLVILGMPWFLVSILLAQTVYTLISSYSSASDFEREWLGRAGGWYMLIGLGWIGFAVVALLGPALYYHPDVLIANGPTWFTSLGAVSGAITAFLGNSRLTQASGPAKGWPAITSNIAIAIAGPIFAVILLILLSVLFDTVALGVHFDKAVFFSAGSSSSEYWPNWRWSGGVALVLIAIAVTADFFVNVNRFSLHAVYRNRLIRAYLGIRTGRKPDGFTGFDLKDNIKLTEIWSDARPRGKDWRPYHVLNMTLNLASTKNLAWQQRKAMSFIASPKYCGAADLGYRRTEEYGDPSGGISLGTAMAISGAAVSSNMGYYTSPSISFLLTLLNVRLGWWLGNPGSAGDYLPRSQRWIKQILSGRSKRRLAPYTQDAPWFSILPLLTELLARTNEDSAYVYLSDGGHFEDLGIYEMVRRRCKWIIVCDGDEDAERNFEDLGNAVRKVWIDLGVRIRFTDSPLLQADKDTKPAQVPYFALGTIDYVSDLGVPEKDRQGHILYIKPVVRGDEDAGDVIAYWRLNPEFPDQSTADQWFDEPQLEAYRALGYLSICRIIEASGMATTALSGFETLFDGLDNVDATTMKPKSKPGDT
jgi:hypothetical protein